ncbi:MAG: DNA-binding protein WhiA [Ruminococcaceae bacterium]|nr:DNA-binding protein WhiA [Oscillospiraceae bacterium]
MSYTDSVREQLYNVEVKNKCCIPVEYAAIRLCLAERSGNFKETVVSSESQDFIKRMQFLCSKIHNIKPDISVYTQKSKKTKREKLLYSISLPKFEYGMCDSEELFKSLESDCCGKSFLRGLFMMRGTVTEPSVRSVHLESGFESEVLRDKIAEIMLSHGLNVKKGMRRKMYTYYIKDSESVSDFLTMIGAQKARFDFDNAKAMREINNQSNRAINIDVANYDKVSISSSKHLAAIRFLLEHDMYDSLSPELKSVAEVRMKYPDASLSELCEKHSPPLSKAGINHRLKKLEQTALEAEKNLF